MFLRVLTGSGPAGFGASQTASDGDGSSGGGSRVGATNRPLGAMPSKMAQADTQGDLHLTYEGHQ
eukprot:1145918-Pelagomonas_calceolata.AAC.9